MKLRLKYPVFVRPDKDGEYPEAIARQLIAAGIAFPVEQKANQKNEGKKK